MHIVHASGQVPNEWKTAKISAIFKKGSKQDPGNYRPISVLPTISKIMERIVHNQLYDYLQTHNILSQEQSGFREKHSTQTSLHFLTEKFYNSLNNNEIIGMIALDLRKAFDTVNHAILLQKLDAYGIKGIAHGWFESYLEGRSQIAAVNGELSEPQNITTGVPQGSILGPLFFIIYVNDLPNSLKHCETNMFADDTTIYINGKDITLVSELLQNDLANIYEWLNTNKLSLHIGKTNSMLICNRQKQRHLQTNQLSINLEGQNLAQVDHLPYLGVELDNHLSFNPQLDKTCNKISRALGVLKRASKHLPIESRTTLYNTLVLPHFDYACTVWSNTSMTNLTRLQRLQNRGMRILLKEGPRAHITDMLVQLKWMSVKQRLQLKLSTLMYNITHNQTPAYMRNFCEIRSQHTHNTRASSGNNLFKEMAHQYSLNSKGVNCWNNIPPHIRQLPSLLTFKTAVSKYIRSSSTRFF